MFPREPSHFEHAILNNIAYLLSKMKPYWIESTRGVYDARI